MKLLQLTQTDNTSVFVKPEVIAAFHMYDSGSSVELTTGGGYIVKESAKTIVALLNIAAGGNLTVIDTSDITI